MKRRKRTRSFFFLLLDLLLGEPEPPPPPRPIRSDFDRIADYPDGYQSVRFDAKEVLR